MSQMPIDLDAEAIYFEGHWYTRDDLARRIKAMLDAGDFAVTRPSAALEQLTSVISSVRTLAFRATPDLVEAVNAGAARAGKSVGGFIRDALSAALGMPSSDFGPARGTGQQPRPGDPDSPDADGSVGPVETVGGGSGGAGGFRAAGGGGAGRAAGGSDRGAGCLARGAQRSVALGGGGSLDVRAGRAEPAEKGQRRRRRTPVVQLVVFG